MEEFLGSLGGPSPSREKPTLAERATAMAREMARSQSQREQAEMATLEMRPNAAPPDPFSLGLYVDGLIRRMNRSAAFVSHDSRSEGVRAAAVQFRINPDGTLKSFTILNAADQADQIAFIRSVVERSAPFAPFPPDILKAAQSLAMTICIIPARQGSGFGFGRLSGNHC